MNTKNGFLSRAPRIGAWLGLSSLFAFLGLGGGCSVSAETICDLKCNCEGCTDSQYDNCVADIEGTTDKAKEYGCEDQYSDWLGCVDREAECRNGDKFAWDGCDIEEDALAKCGGGDSCGLAAKKLCDQCNFSCADPDPSECTGSYECTSKCMLNATCEEIANPPPDSAYAQCLSACSG